MLRAQPFPREWEDQLQAWRRSLMGCSTLRDNAVLLVSPYCSSMFDKMFLMVLTSHKAANLTNEEITTSGEGVNQAMPSLQGRVNDTLQLVTSNWLRVSLMLLQDDYSFHTNPEDIIFKAIFTQFYQLNSMKLSKKQNK